MRGDHLYRPVVFEEPDLIVDPPAWSGLIPFAFWVVDALRPRVLVELGTHSGVSYCAFCQAVSYLKLPTTCCAVDTWQGDAHAGFYGEEVFRALASYHDPRYGSFSRLIRTTFDQAVEHFSDSSIDLLHIDGCHTYDAVRHDFQTWLPKLSHRSVVLFHDINVREMDFGIWRFWEEITQQYPSFSLFHSHGLGVLAVGTKLPKPIRWLTEASKRDTQETIQIRAFFARLGGAVVASIEKRHLRTETDRLRTLTAERENQIATLKKNISEKDVHIRNLEAAVHDKDTHISNLDTALSDKDNHIRNIEADLKTASQKLAEKDAELQQQEARLQEVEENRQILKRHLTEEGKRVEHLQTQVGQLISRLATTEGDLRDKTAAAGKLEERLHASESLMESYRDQLELVESSLSWKLIQRFWSWNMRWLPFGTRRRKAYTAVARGLAHLLFGLKVRGEIPDQPASPVQPVPQPVPGEEKDTQEQQEEIRMNCDEPRPAEFCGGVFLVRGWAIAPSGIETVEILLDGEKIAQAIYGQKRDDVAKEFPDIKDSRFSGFLHLLDSSNVVEGSHLLTISVLSKEGTRRDTQVPVTIDQTLKIREYDRWIEQHEPSPEKLKRLAREAKGFSYRPLISIVVPVYRTPVELLREAVESVRNQIYTNWELCLGDDCSESEEITQLLTEYADQDSRIKFTQMSQNLGISGVTNAAISLGHGEFVAFMDSDDVLAPDALYWVVKLLQENRDADLIYSDEDKLDLAGRRCEPFFKPDWSPDLLLSMNYISHFTVARGQIIDAVGGLRSEYDGSQDYDFLLRVVERTNRIHHISRILYHWRASETSSAMSADVRPKAHIAAQNAIADYLKRNHTAARVEQGVATGRWRVRYEILEWPRVAVIMPTGGNLDLLGPCLESVFSKTDYPNYEIVLVDNSKGPHVQQYFASLHNRNGKLSYIDYRNRSFNFSALNNFAVRQITAPLILFLNDETEATDPDWLTAMVEHGQRPTVGAVGAKLLFPSGFIQHAGVVMGIYENTAHAFKNLPGDSGAYFDFPQIVRNCSAVTAGCMLTKRNLFLELGGFDEKDLRTAFQDVDYCLKLCQRGYFVVYTPYAVLFHHESVTKKEKVANLREVRFMRRKWGKMIARDPYYNPHLTRKLEDYSLNLDS